MRIPAYWAEGRAQRRQRIPQERRQLTVRRWGWSDESASAAQQHADQRAAEALERLWARPNSQAQREPQREPRVAYNGAEGVPIREELLQRHGEQAITRNGYGAHCLNSPNLFIADIDFGSPKLGWRAWLLALVLAAMASAVTALWYPSAGVSLLVFVAVLALTPATAESIWALGPDPKQRQQRRALDRVRAFAAAHPRWQLRVYATPAGLRLLAPHAAMDPTSPAVQDAFKALGSDPRYARMCQRQACFRARLTGKPWRMGLSEHAPGHRVAWPLSDEQAARRAPWLAQYERLRGGFAACRHLETLGQASTAPELAAAVALHDQQAQALSPLPMA